MRAILAVLLLLTIAFAGCASKGGNGDDDSDATGTATSTASRTTSSSSRSGTSSASGTATATGAPGENHAPTAAISAVVNGTNATFDLAGADQDGDGLSWNLTFGDGQGTNGTSLPANVTHSYAVGNYTAELTVSDGTDSVTQNVTVQIVAGGASGAPLQSASVSWDAAASGCLAEYPAVPPADAAGNVAYGLVEVAAVTIGRTYTAVITWDEGPFALGADISFYAADGSFVDGNLVDGAPPVTLTGTVPAGAAFAVFTMCDAVASAEATYVVV